ncbi:hypothetical protein DMB92_05145 [Campylobacter sp. MIT 99-7217]|nr:hypothetical protein DMB92_05145 [Campylobacter sp. MIT 99-7217]
MCGGLNLAFLKLNASFKFPFLLSLVYHIFRIFGYVLLGVLFSLFSLGFKFSSFAQGILFFMLGIFMIILGFALIFRGKLLKFIEELSFFSQIQRKILSKFTLKGLKSACILGFANAFMPCGLVYFFLAFAMSRTNAFEAALIMLVFGLSTLPALLFLSKFFTFLHQNLQKIYTFLADLIIIFYGLYLSFKGFLLTN